MDLLSAAVLDKIEYKTEKGYSQGWQKPSEASNHNLFYAFGSIRHCIKDSTIIDGACGTGGMMTLAEEQLKRLATEHNKEVSIHLFGQEINPETYAIAKSDMLLQGNGEGADNIKYGSTLSNDGFPNKTFDFMLSNPPYGKSWKTDADKMGGKNDINDPRFVVNHAGDPEFKMIPRSSDGQLLFLVNKLTKMKTNTTIGSRIAEVHNGSSLFTGDAGQGESNIRRWIIENDWLECIVALPENMFYNTGISTFIWILTNRKPSHRRGKVQLIDATCWKSPLRKNLGNKNCEFTPEIIQRITDAFLKFDQTEQSKIFQNEEFGYSKITVERPLRLSVELSEDNVKRFNKVCITEKDTELSQLVDALVTKIGRGKLDDYNKFIGVVNEVAEKMGIRMNSKRLNLIKNNLANVDETAQPVIKKLNKVGKEAANPLYGMFEVNIDGKKCIVEYEPDSNFRDTEQIPLLEEGGIEAFFKKEVLTFAPDAWIDSDKMQIGYEISFTKYFYKPIQLRSLDEIRAEILSLEAETDGLLNEIIGG